MNKIILAAALLITVGAPAMASQNHNGKSGQMQSTHSAAATGKVHFNEFHIKKTTDKSSPVLFL